ncbi:hypothetical protein [Pseudomonas umsongensis]
MQLTLAQSLICSRVLAKLDEVKDIGGSHISDLIKIEAASGMGLSTCLHNIRDKIGRPYLFITPDRHLGRVSLLESLLVELGLPSTPKSELRLNGVLPLYIQDIFNMRGISVVFVEDLHRFNFERQGLRPTYHNDLPYLLASLPQASFLISETEPVESLKIIHKAASHNVVTYKLHGFTSLTEYYQFVLQLSSDGAIASNLVEKICLWSVTLLFKSLNGNLASTINVLSNPFLYERHILDTKIRGDEK